jgi:bifunctional ADP-heptose synthase (sugar kinase/adenylyltransferase)
LEGVLRAKGLHDYLVDPTKTGNEEYQVAHVLRENVECKEFKSIFKQAKHISEVWMALKKRWEQSTLASKLLVCERLYSLEKTNPEYAWLTGIVRHVLHALA